MIVLKNFFKLININNDKSNFSVNLELASHALLSGFSNKCLYFKNIFMSHTSLKKKTNA